MSMMTHVAGRRHMIRLAPAKITLARCDKHRKLNQFFFASY